MNARIKAIETRRAQVADLVATGKLSKQIAPILGVDRTTVLRDARAIGIRIKGMRISLTEDELRSRIAAGRSLTGIAADLGVTRHAIYQRIQRNGWDVRK